MAADFRIQLAHPHPNRVPNLPAAYTIEGGIVGLIDQMPAARDLANPFAVPYNVPRPAASKQLARPVGGCSALTNQAHLPNLRLTGQQPWI
jgi:hypothetical protein